MGVRVVCWRGGQQGRERHVGARRGRRGEVEARPQAAAHDHDLPWRGYRGGSLRRERGDPQRGGASGGPYLCHYRGPRGLDYAYARGDGGGSAIGRFLFGLRSDVSGQLGRVHHRMAVLVLLGHRGRGRGRGRGRDHLSVSDGGAALGNRARRDRAADPHQPLFGRLVRRVRVLVRLHKGGRDHRVHLPRRPVRLRVVALRHARPSTPTAGSCRRAASRSSRGSPP